MCMIVPQSAAATGEATGELSASGITGVASCASEPDRENSANPSATSTPNDFPRIFDFLVFANEQQPTWRGALFCPGQCHYRRCDLMENQ
jgi:hypothetical protein